MFLIKLYTGAMHCAHINFKFRQSLHKRINTWQNDISTSYYYHNMIVFVLKKKHHWQETA